MIDQRPITPVEAAQVALQEAEQRLAELNRVHHEVCQRRAALKDIDQEASNVANAEAGKLNLEIRFHISRVGEARGLVASCSDFGIVSLAFAPRLLTTTGAAVRLKSGLSVSKVSATPPLRPRLTQRPA